MWRHFATTRAIKPLKKRSFSQKNIRDVSMAGTRSRYSTYFIIHCKIYETGRSDKQNCRSACFTGCYMQQSTEKKKNKTKKELIFKWC